MGLSPVDIAVMNPDPEVLHRLIANKHHNRINEIDEEGCSAFHRLDSGHWQHTSCDIKYSQRLFRGSPQRAQQNLRETIRVLIDHEGNINLLTKPKEHRLEGKTPLMLAVEANQLETVKSCLQQVLM